MNRILVLEDEKMLNDMMCEYLSNNGYSVTGVKSYDEALDLAYGDNFDLWIFDVKIIGGNGFDLLSELRQASKTTPCIFVTSLNTLSDLNKGFMSGCDDFLKKPFELAELLIRVNNLIKRNFAHKSERRENLGNGLSFDMFDKLLYKDNKLMKFSKKELDLFALLYSRKDTFVGRDEIYSTVWNYDESASELSLRVYIRNLRKVFGDKIVSKPKVGYSYVS